ncbi:MAG: p-hydroxycinnamoyl CoA hydratase/lyase [Hyphomicrobiales bacterium]|nr:p-hydroxycinnamoyl CoA hydratase/lyase [Hyphomicrobiales bacterium]
MQRTDLSAITLDIEDGIAWIALNRPEKKNAMSPRLHEEMDWLLADIEADDAAKVIVLTGKGDSWCAGQDLKAFFREGVDNPKNAKRLRETSERWRSLRLQGYDKPTIAMVNGFCFGGAFTQLTSCDFAIAAETATFGLSEVNWGMIPGGIVAKALVDSMDFRDALYYASTGEAFDGKRAAELKLVNKAVPADALREETIKLAKTLMAKNPHTLRAIKHAMRSVRRMDYFQAFDYLGAKLAEMRYADPSNGRQKAMEQFLDDKTYRPGLGAYKTEK